MNSYELNAKRMALKDSLSKAEHHIIDLASDPNADKEQIETAQKHRDDLKAKFEAINAAYKKTASEKLRRLLQ